MDSDSQIPEDIEGLAAQALRHGLERAARGGHMLAFVIFVGKEQSVLADFAAHSSQESLQGARDAISKASANIMAYALAHDGFITYQGERSDAILVEVGSRAQENAYLFAQRYTPKGLFRALREKGKTLFLGTEKTGFAPIAH